MDPARLKKGGLMRASICSSDDKEVWEQVLQLQQTASSGGGPKAIIVVEKPGRRKEVERRRRAMEEGCKSISLAYQLIPAQPPKGEYWGIIHGCSLVVVAEERVHIDA